MTSNLNDIPSSVRWNHISDFVVTNQESDAYPINPPYDFKMDIGDKNEIVPEHVQAGLNPSVSASGTRFNMLRLRLNHISNNLAISGTSLWLHLLQEAVLHDDLSFVTVWTNGQDPIYSKCVPVKGTNWDAIFSRLLIMTQLSASASPYFYLATMSSIIELLFQPRADESLVAAHLGFQGTEDIPTQWYPCLVDFSKPSLLGHIIAALLKIPPGPVINYAADFLNPKVAHPTTVDEFNDSHYNFFGTKIKKLPPGGLDFTPQQGREYYLVLMLLWPMPDYRSVLIETIPDLTHFFEAATIRPYFDYQDKTVLTPFPPLSLLNILSPVLIKVEHGRSINFNGLANEISGYAPVKAVQLVKDPKAKATNKEAYVLDSPLNFINLFTPPGDRVIVHVKLELPRFKINFPMLYGSNTTLSGSLDSNIGKFLLHIYTYSLAYSTSNCFTSFSLFPPRSLSSTYEVEGLAEAFQMRTYPTPLASEPLAFLRMSTDTV